MLFFLLFANQYLRRPPFFSFIGTCPDHVGEVPTGSEPTSLAPAALCPLFICHGDENPVTATPLRSVLTNRDARKPFRMCFYENCRVVLLFLTKIFQEKPEVASPSDTRTLLTFPILRSLGGSLSSPSDRFPRHSNVQPFNPKTCNFFRILTSRNPLRQLLCNPHLPEPSISADSNRLISAEWCLQPSCNQHLRGYPVSAENAGLITRLESAVTRNTAASPLKSTPTKSRGDRSVGGIRERGWFRRRLRRISRARDVDRQQEA